MAQQSKPDDSMFLAANVCELIALLCVSIAIAYWTHWTVGVVIWAVIFGMTARAVRREASEGENDN